MSRLLKRKLLNSISFALCIVFLISFVPTPTIYAETDKSKSDRIIVSMGDSYSSGEGIEKFYDQDLPLSEKVKSVDWLAHRSQKSWGGQLTLPGVDGTMAENRNSNWYFVASSGAETKHIREEQPKPYYKENGVFQPPYTNKYEITKDGEIISDEAKLQDRDWKLPPQDKVFERLENEGKKADYVTITIGGNDMGFSKIVGQAGYPGFIWGGSSYWNKNGFSDLIDMLHKHIMSDDITETLIKTYKYIQAESGAKIIVADYPKLLEQNGINGFFNQYESEAINDAVHIFNMKIHRAVLQCEIDEGHEGVYHYVSVEDGFEGHGAYSSDEYLRGVEILKQDEDLYDTGIVSSYSMHPNEKGAEIYRACVQAKINELERTTSDERDIVLVLDVSGSMSGTPIEETKRASTKFIETILDENASIGIVTYDNSANMVSDFSVNKNSLKSVANNIGSGGGTNIEAGLIKAQEMLSTSNAKKKIIVLMSDGEPNDGKVGDELISYADSIKADGTYIYTLGFFESMGSGKSDAQVLMEKIASDGCHYEVANADDLKFFFGDIADQINGQKYIYVRIACPVDVKVTYNGETLRSDEDDTNERTSFGSLTFEENKNGSEDGGDNRIKILRLKDGTDYDVQIEGNGSGKMNYTIGFMDETGKYSDMRKFSNLEISPKTQIDTVASNTFSTTLNVDSDGDGKYDLKYKAKANSTGEIVDYSYIRYIIYITGILIILLILYIQIKKWKRKSAEKVIKKKASQKRFCVHCGSTVSGDKKFCPKCGSKME